MRKTRRRRIDAILAPSVRRARGEVVSEAFVETDTRGRVTGRGTRERVLITPERWLKRGEISELQFVAARMLLDAVEATGRGVRSSLNFEPSDGDPEAAALHRGGRYAQAAARVRGALAAAGSTLAPVLIAVIIDGQSATAWAAAAGRPPRDGIAAVRLALDALVEHFKLAERDRRHRAA